jgi:hypothetical protein
VLLVALVAVGIVLFQHKQDDDRSPGARPAPAKTTTTTRPAATPDERTASRQLGTLTVVAEGRRAGYERAAFGEGWAIGPDGCDVREEVLATESLVPVTRRAGSDHCTIVRGRWRSIYDNDVTSDPGDLQIDHMVPLAEAWESGASRWPAERRQRYANDTRRPDALVAVTAAMNESKSDQDPAEWQPPNRHAWCRYARAWITEKAAWHLTVDPDERDTLGHMLATC